LHSRASKLACLGELGRHPVFLKALSLAIKYNWQLKYKSSKDSLIHQTYREMEVLAANGVDCWLTRINTINNHFKINLHGQMSPEGVSSIIKKALHGQFEIFWKDKINDAKIGIDNVSHNKLRFYSQFKSCFKQEPYIEKVNNRNQRSWLARVRTSAHNLGIERGRHRNIPIHERLCVYCRDGGVQQLDGEGVQPQPHVGEVDCELHFLIKCPRFKSKRLCFLKRLECYVPNIMMLSDIDQAKTILCPTTPQTAKLANKFMGLMFKARDAIDSNETLLEYPTWHPGSANPFMKTFDENDLDESHNFSDITFASDESFNDAEQ
jgi:hypothetical protein